VIEESPIWVRRANALHVQDEPRLEGLQTGVRYADGSPKSSLPAFRHAASDDSCG
jgi:hypothetical protein